jgi:hypothetical protein
VERIAAAVAEPEGWRAEPEALAALLAASAEGALLQRWSQALQGLEHYWRQRAGGQVALQVTPVWKVKLRALASRLWRSAR